MTVEDKLRELGYPLPKPPLPKGAYVPAVEVDDFVYTAGSICVENGVVKYRGKLGSDLTVAQGREAARCTILNLLSVLKQQIGDLDRIARVVKVFVGLRGQCTWVQRSARGAKRGVGASEAGVWRAG